jgi:hypothetical protein
MDKKLIAALASNYGITEETAKKIYLDICKHIATELVANQKQTSPFFVIKPISRPERIKDLPDGSQKTIKAKMFGKIMLKGS